MAQQSKPIQVLLVEDNPIDAKLLGGDFSRLGSTDFAMTRVERLSEAIHFLEKKQVDVILLDLFLPDTSGLDTLSRMRAAAPYIPIVVLTGLNDEALALQALQGSAQDYLIKGSLDTRAVFRSIRYAIERKHVEEELRNSERRYRDLFQNACDSIYTLDMEGNFTSVNRKFEAITGYSPDELTGKSISRVVAEQYRPALLQLIAPDTPGSDLSVNEIELLAKDGRRIPVEVSTALICEKGNTTGTQWIARDISERKLIEQRLLEKQKLEAIGTLAAGVAHNFNNMLTIVLGYCALMSERMGSDHPEAQSVGAIKKASERAAILTRQLLAFSRKQGILPALLHLNEIVLEMQQLLESVLGQTIDLRLELAPGLGLIKADRGQIEQIVMNLAINARDAMKDGGCLTIATAMSDFEVALTISDTGCGMSAETCSHIFEPFFSTKGLAEASGLGLSTVYGNVKQNGGSIHAASTPESGTTFSMGFPLFAPETKSTAPVTLLNDPPELRNASPRERC